MKVSKHFEDHEIVPPEVYHSGELSNIWLVSQWQIDVAEFFRERFGSTIINDYGWGGNVYADGITYKYSGTRPPFQDVVGATWSQHKFMNALDLKFPDFTPDEVREDIKDNEDLYLEHGVTTIESGDIADTWVHVDGRKWEGERKGRIVIVGR